MKRTKSIVALVLAVVLVFALSASAFATDTVNVTVKVYSNTNPSAYTTIASYQPTISNGDTIADVIHAILPGSASYWKTSVPLDPVYSPLYDPNDPLYDPDGQLGNNPNYVYYADILRTVTLNNTPYGTVDYVPNAYFEEGDPYVAGIDAVLDNYNAAYLAQYGGLQYYLGDGLFSTQTGGNTLIYIGCAWNYTVNGDQPYKTLVPSDPYYGDSYYFYMNEVLAASGDNIVLTYDHYSYVTSF